MFDHLPLTNAGSSACHALDRLADFLGDHGDALVEAAELLGGTPAWPRCIRLRGRVRKATRVDPGLLRELRALHRLLTLEAVDDLDSEEAGRFAMIDPADPVVHGLCALADALGDLLAEIEMAAKRQSIRSAA